MLLVGGFASGVAAAPAPDRSEVVLVLDFSASILVDEANRNRFGAALEEIADRVEETSSDLVAGDATVSIVQFASGAVDYPGCASLHMLGSPEAVKQFADCLRSVAKAYRDGLNTALEKKIGVDTNYVAAMERAAKHLPANAVRPTLILLSDGKHDVKGVPASEVKTTYERLFANRSPFAFLPVGMGLDPKERDALEAGLQRLQVIREMPACISGTTFEWPQVVFKSAAEAGSAVAVALQDATCTFTVAPTPSPSSTPAPTAEPTPTPSTAVAQVSPTPSEAVLVASVDTLSCGSPVACNPVLRPILVVLGLILAGCFATMLVVFNRDRRRGYVIAVVDVVHIANLGHGSRLGIGFVRDPATKRVTGIMVDRRRHADIRIRNLGDGRFDVKDRVGHRITAAGEAIVTADSLGGKHELVLKAFVPHPASVVSDRR